MNVNIMVRMIKRFFVLLLAVCLSSACIPEAFANVGVFENIQMLMGDVYTVPARGLQRVSITDPNIVDISDAKPEQVIIVGLQPGETVLFLWDESGKRSFIVQVLSEDLGLIKAKINMIFKNSDIKGVTVEQNDLEGKVMLSGSIPENKIESVARIADFFPGSILNLVKKEEIEDMVQIDMQITELATTLNKAMGVQWATTSGTGESNGSFTPGVAESNIPQTGKIQDVFKLGDFNRVGQILARVNMLVTEGKGRVLSKPRLVVRSGKEATFQVGGEIPITSVTSDTAGNKVTQNTTFKSYGVSLGVTPTIVDGKVDVLLNTEISDIDPSTATIVSKDLAFVTRSAQTQLLLSDQQTIVLAGMIKKNRSEVKERVPFFGSIPVIGLLFRNKQMATPDKDTEVVISLTPSIIKSSKKADREELAKTVAMPASKPVVKKEDQIVMSSGRNEVKLPVIMKNAGNVPVIISENLKPYAESVQQRISSAIAYPYEAQENHWQGTVKIGMVLRKDGSLRDIFVKESSGYDVFDLDAVNTAQILAPYSPFPQSMAQEEITVTLPIVYSLDAFLKNVAKQK